MKSRGCFENLTLEHGFLNLDNKYYGIFMSTPLVYTLKLLIDDIVIGNLEIKYSFPNASNLAMLRDCESRFRH